MKIEEILAEWKKDSPLNQAKLDEESINTAMLHAKYLEIYSAVKIKHARMKSKLKALELDKRRYLKGLMTREEMDDMGWDYDPWKGLARPMKSEMDDYIKVDPEMAEYGLKMKECEIMIEALHDIMQHIQWRHSHVKNAIDFMRFQAGG